MISIWLTPAEEDSKYLQNIITDLASEYEAPVFSPHCTLFSPADLEAKELETILEQVAEGFAPLYITIDKLNYTSNIWKTIFIELEKSSELEQLQQRLVNFISDPKPYEFLPHISLIYKEMSDEKKETIICNLSVRNNYKMDRILAMKTGPDVESWEKVVEIPLYA